MSVVIKARRRGRGFRKETGLALPRRGAGVVVVVVVVVVAAAAAAAAVLKMQCDSAMICLGVQRTIPCGDHCNNSSNGCNNNDNGSNAHGRRREWKVSCVCVCVCEREREREGIWKRVDETMVQVWESK